MRPSEEARFRADVAGIKRLGSKRFPELESDFGAAWRKTKTVAIACTTSSVFGDGAEGGDELRQTYEATREGLGWAMWKISNTLQEIGDALVKIAENYEEVDRAKAD